MISAVESLRGQELKGQIDDLDEEIAAEHALSPSSVEIGERLGSGGLLNGFSRGLQFLNAIPRGNEHVAVLCEVGFIAERTVAGDDFGVIAGERENFVGSCDHAVEFAAGARVDEGIKAVEKSVAHVDDVGFFEMNVDVGIRMGGGKVLERERFAIGLQLVAGGEGLLRQSIGR